MSAGAFSSAAAQSGPAHAGEQDLPPTIQRTFSLTSGGIVRLDSPRGPVAVRSGPPGEVFVRAWVRPVPESGQGIGSIPGGEQLRFASDSGSLSITVPSDRTGPGTVPRYSIRFELTVPPGCDLVLKTGEGSLSVTGVRGSVRMETDSGDLVARSCGPVEAGSVNGDIVIEGCRGASVNTVSGTISIRRTEGPVTATCVSGSISMEGVRSSSVRASTTGGDISFLGPVLEGGAYRLFSHSGDITFTARSGRGFALNLSTFSGSIAVPLDVTLTDAPISRRSLQGRWGDAAASVELKAFSGDIRLEATAGR